MSESTLQLLEMLQLMDKIEIAMADFYSSIAEAWHEDAKFWQTLVEAEKKHSQFLRQAAALVLENPSDFEKGASFNKAAVETVLKGIADNTARVKSGEMSHTSMLHISRDYEHAMMELQYQEIVHTRNEQYLRLINVIDTQTGFHMRSLDERVSLDKG